MTIIPQKKKRSGLRERPTQHNNSGSFSPDAGSTAPLSQRGLATSHSSTLPPSPPSRVASVATAQASSLGATQPYSATINSSNSENTFPGSGENRRRRSSDQQPQLIHVVQQQYPSLLQTSQFSTVGSNSCQSASLSSFNSSAGGGSSSFTMHHRRFSDFEEDGDNDEEYDSENYNVQPQQRGPAGSNALVAAGAVNASSAFGARRLNNPNLFSAVNNNAVENNNVRLAAAANDGDESCAADEDVDSQYYADVNNQLTEEEWVAREQRFALHVKRVKNFDIKEMVGDGACLFRAVADQVFGDQEMHDVVRKNCCDYMVRNMDFFSQYLTENFHEYITRKRLLTTHADHLEVQALAEIYSRPIEVYEYDATPINIFQSSTARSSATAGQSPPRNSNSSSTTTSPGSLAQQQQKPVPIRVSYHRRCHYNSLRHPYEATVGVGLGLPGLDPGGAERTILQDALQQSERTQLEACMLEDKLVASDIDATQNALQEEIERQSYLEWMQQMGRSDRSSVMKQQAASSSSAAKKQPSSSPLATGEVSKSVDSKPLSAVIVCSSSSLKNCAASTTTSRQTSPLSADSKSSALNTTQSADNSGAASQPPPFARKSSPKRDINTVNSEDAVAEAPTSGAQGGSSARSDDKSKNLASTTTLTSSSVHVPTRDAGSSNTSAVLYSSFGDFVPEAEEDDVVAQVLALSRQEYFASQARRNDGCANK